MTGHIPQLDGLRGVAILLVLAVHSPAVRVLQYGWMGVDLFFVLSGFLITGILLESKGRQGYFSSFYARRAVRIWPLYLLMLLIVFVGMPLWSGTAPSDGRWLWYVAYLQNYWPNWEGPSSLHVTWSLAIEEQFYVVWPLVVFLLSRRTLAWISAAIVVASPILRWVLLERGVGSGEIYTWTFTRADGLAAGALVALAVRAPAATGSRVLRVSAVAAGIGALSAAAALPPGFGLETEATSNVGFALGFSALSVAFAGVLGLALTWSPLARALRARPLAYVGKVSYGLYVYHLLIFTAVRTSFVDWFAGATGAGWLVSRAVAWPLAFALTFATAEASWRFFESPILRLKSRFAPGPARGKPARPALPLDGAGA